MIPLAAVSVAGMFLAGCGNTTKPAGTNVTGEQTPVEGGTLTYGQFSDINTVNPLFIQDTASGDAASFMYANLFDYDPKGNVVAAPWSLADGMPQISDDGKTYTIKLKNNAKWSDGTPVNADDVIFTINSIKDPHVGSPGISSYDKVQSVSRIDDQTVKIQLKQVYAPFLYYLIMAVVPYHILKDVKPQDLQKNAYGTDPMKTVSDGPWNWTEWKQKQYLSFDRNPNYWGPKPHIDKVVYKIYASQTTEVQALLKGDIDVVSGIPVTQLEAVQKKPQIQTLVEPGPQYEYLGFNFDPKNFPDHFDPFLGEKTRQAVAYALNRQGMVTDVLKGTGKLMNSPFLPGSWADPGDAAVNYPYDSSKAKQLLTDDGWTPGSDGILQKDGHRFSFELQYNVGNSRRKQIAEIIQQNLKDVGIEVKPRAIDFSSWISQNINTGKFPAILLAWVMNTPDPDQESTFSSKYFPPNGQNAGWYKDPTLDDLWVKGYSTTDQSQRKEIYKEAAKEISTNLPYVFLYQYGSPEGLGPNVHFATADKPQLSLAYGYLFHVQNWWIGKK